MTAFGRTAELARWGMAGVVVLAAHAGVGLWLHQSMQRRVSASAEAIFMDLIPEPAAPAPAAEATPAESSPEPAAETPPPETLPEPADFLPPPLPELPPVEDFAALLPEAPPPPDFEVPPLTELPPITDFAALLPESALLLNESQRPMSRPARRKPDPEPRREEPRRQAAEPRQEPRSTPEQRQTRQPAQQVAPQPSQSRQQSQGSAPAQQGAGASKGQMDRWQGQLFKAVQRHMKRAGNLGAGRGSVSVRLSITIAANGRASARMMGSTGNARADAALARQAARMPSLPRPPSGRTETANVSIVIEF